MAINTSKVVVGGLAAGVVMNIIGFVGNGMLLGPKMQAEMGAVAPALAQRGMAPMNIAAAVITQFIVGILLVWLYASMRPRYGPGFKTAAYAGLAIWICGLLFYQDWVHMGLRSAMTYSLASLFALISLMVGAWVGGMLYKENGAVPMA
jgi:hypothetical protein